jgi:hypothetical protein
LGVVDTHPHIIRLAWIWVGSVPATSSVRWQNTHSEKLLGEGGTIGEGGRIVSPITATAEPALPSIIPLERKISMPQ